MKHSGLIVAIVLLGSLAGFSQNIDTDKQDTDEHLTKCILSNMQASKAQSAYNWHLDNEASAKTASGDWTQPSTSPCQPEIVAWWSLCRVRRTASNPSDSMLVGCRIEKQELVDAAIRTWESTHPPPPSPPRYVAVTARGVSVVPGAIVCPSHDAVSLMFDLYVSHWEDATQDAMTKGQSRLIRGQPTPAPNLKAHGCVLLPPGTPMTLDSRNVVPVVTAKLPNGTTIKGVTLPAMIGPGKTKALQVQDSKPTAASSEAPQEPAPVRVEEARPSAVQPEVPNEPEPVSVLNPTLPAQPPSIAEIHQQAIALWNQERYSDAIPLFNQACSGGKADSCNRLGLMYDFGEGVAQDFPRALAFYSKSCNSGNGAACYHLSMLPQSLPGGCNSGAVTRNLSRSCDVGIATSCSMIGYSYIHGCGVAKDTEKGRQLLSKACSLGDPYACDGIK